jgi:hypothetical protein
LEDAGLPWLGKLYHRPFNLNAIGRITGGGVKRKLFGVAHGDGPYVRIEAGIRIIEGGIFIQEHHFTGHPVVDDGFNTELDRRQCEIAFILTVGIITAVSEIAYFIS